MYLTIDGTVFRDEHNRQVTLRGVNLAGDAKLPARPNLPSHIAEEFFDGDNASFVGRPFPYDQADTHLKRLRDWGFNVIRYIFTWEAIEHKGPGIYDEEWIDSTIALLRKLQDYGFMVFMDPHQDVWSRFSGGSGAPMWTLYAMGLNPQAFDSTEAALVHNIYPEPEKFPKMIWSTNYERLACLTMFTMFFAGRDFTPNCIINGKNIQDFLHDHYLNAIKHLAQRIHESGDLTDTTVIGWESFNEPSRGLIGFQRLDAYPTEQRNHKGTSPTAWQAILTGSGRACEVENWDIGGTGPYRSGKTLVDPKGIKAWLPLDYDDTKYGWKRDPGWKLGECIWAQHGVWDPSTDTLLKNDYFSRMPDGTPLDTHAWVNIYFMSHFRKYAKAIRSVHKKAILFCQPPFFEIPPVIKGTSDEDDRLVYAPHFYDGITLMTKSWNRLWNIDVLGVLRGRYWSPLFAIKFGETAIRNCFKDQLCAIRDEGIQNIGRTPCVFTEIGIPYDMDGKKAYKTGDYTSQIKAMDANNYALEGAGVGFTLWSYTAKAGNDHEWGDQWNGEDLSIFSVDDKMPTSEDTSVQLGTKDNGIGPVIRTLSFQAQSSSEMSIESSRENTNVAGNRAVEAFVRPFPIYTIGRLTKYGFDLVNVTFELSLESETSTQNEAPNEIFLPGIHFPPGQFNIEVSGGKWELDTERSVLKWWHMEGEQHIKVTGIKKMVMEAEDSNTLLQTCSKACPTM